MTAVPPLGTFFKSKFYLKNASNDAYYSLWQNGSLTANATVTLPDFATNTLASANNAQTFTGDQTFSGQILGKNGTVSSTSHSFSSDIDTGLYWKSSGSMGFVSNGVECGSYSSAGQWTFGETSGSLVHLFQSGAQTDLKVNAVGSNYSALSLQKDGTTRFRITVNNSNNDVIFDNDAGFRFGSATTLANWSFGNTGTNLIHSFLGLGQSVDGLTQHIQIQDKTALAANVGGCIGLSGYYTGSTGITGAVIKAYKINATDPDKKFGLKFYTNNGTTLTEYGSVADTGAWTFPISTLHTFGGTDAVSVLAISSGGTTRNATMRMLTNGKGFNLNLKSDGSLSLDDNITSDKFGTVSSAGAWTLGPTSTTTIANVAHVIHGGLNTGATGTADANKRFYINCNSYVSGVTALGTRNSATNTLGSVHIALLARTNDTTDCFRVATNSKADGDTGVDAVSIMSATQAGAWTMGAASSSVTHTFNGRVLVFNGDSGTPYFSLKVGAQSFGYFGLTGTSGLEIGTYGATGEILFTNNAGTVGKVSAAGAWTLGPSGGGISHKVWGAKADTSGGLEVYAAAALNADQSNFVQTVNSAGTRAATLGIINKNSLEVPYMRLTRDDAIANCYMWFHSDGKLYVSSNAANIGSNSGVVIATAV